MNEKVEKILVTGASGLLGANAVLELGDRGHSVLGLYRSHALRLKDRELRRCDLFDFDDIRRVFEDFRPTVTLHCAAMTQVDECSARPEEAMRMNRDASAQLAETCRRFDSRLAYVSTDAFYGAFYGAFYDPSQGTHSETERPEPRNHYSATKWEGEKAVQAVLPESLVLRTNIYGWNALEKQSLAEWMLEGLEKQQPLTLFHDVHYSPILVNDWVAAFLDLLEAGASGIFNLGSHEPLTKLEFGRALAKEFGLSEACIQPISVDDKHLSKLAKPATRSERSKKMGMNVDKIESALKRPMPTALEGIRRFRELRSSGFLRRLRS